ncbi:hypothetical protein [Bradyrhizobium cytisi]|uniref:Uncharacterized protein n=1 Tax=Bradyrhizobium cytisi TaxID=515489 RepID=A0A5S4WNF3_9BRAD|nr:hypothetical protein [Bradyrhizobium cytisi]TYL83619.1 hypothetical protein FXB38_18155 [Bradyrhizobium cytisi]
MKIVRNAPPPSPPSRPILKFAAPAPGPHHNPPAATPPTPSNEVAAHAVRVASSQGSINPRQQQS